MSDVCQSAIVITKQIRRVIAVLLMIGFALTGIPESFSQDVTDDEIKAALMFKFPVYVRWPEGAMNENFECCILGNGPISDLLSEFDGEKLMEKRIRVRQLSDISESDGCHILFITSSEKKNFLTILKTVKGKPVLTVGDMKGFAQNGGIINFIRKKNSVRFEINPEAGKRAGLTISSKLLRLAEIVEDR